MGQTRSAVRPPIDTEVLELIVLLYQMSEDEDPIKEGAELLGAMSPAQREQFRRIANRIDGVKRRLQADQASDRSRDNARRRAHR